MPNERHIRLDELLTGAARRPAAERRSYIETMAGGDATLAREALELLPHYVETLGFEPERMVWPLPGTTTISRVRSEAQQEEARDADDPRPPFSIDQYRCLQMIGRGGMGVVYRAVHPTSHREVAIKLLRRARLTPENRWRFAFEGEILRRLMHPSIARLQHLSEMRTARGVQPCLVMEYIAGRPLSIYVEAQQLATLERLRLFCSVCDAVEYAHHRGIVHRDLKPGNILVDENGQPHVLDFGIARIEDLSLSPDSHGFIGTYGYASPEQRRGEMHLTPASDVYALGLIAHELLTGRLPGLVEGKLRLDLRGVRLDWATEPKAVENRQLRYHLLRLLGKALEYSPSRRWRSAGPLGAATEAITEQFAPPSLWAMWKRRIWGAFGSRADDAGPNRALAAVLRSRIEMSMRTYSDREGPKI